jgi:hypothetical protein
MGIVLVDPDLEQHVVNGLVTGMHAQKFLIRIDGFKILPVESIGIAKHEPRLGRIWTEGIPVVELGQGVDGAWVLLVLHEAAGIFEKFLRRVFRRSQEIVINGPASVQKQDKRKKNQIFAHYNYLAHGKWK